MIKEIAWNTFKNTGDLNTYLELKQIQNIEQQIKEQNQNNIILKNEQQMEEHNGNSKNEWYNNF